MFIGVHHPKPSHLPMPKSCKSCAHVLLTDSAPTGFRCGDTYFSQPPAERKMQRMETYLQTREDALCERHQDRDHKLRTDLSIREN